MTDPRSSPSVILVVEDQALLRMAAVDLLQDAGFETLEAQDASAAMAVMKERWQDVQVLFTDVQMPGGIDGIDLAEEVHRNWPDVLLLVTSGGVEVKDEDLPDDGKFVRKPYEGSTLIRQVRQMIANGHTSPAR